MLQIGKMNQLTVTSENRQGFLLDGGNRQVLLPKREVTDIVKVGEKITVFIYNDQKESLKATMRKPKGLVDQCAVLNVKDVTSFGIFLDWGISKDLFVPTKNLKRDYEAGDYALVRLVLDFEKTGVIGTTYIEDFISYEPEGLEPGSEVSMVVVGLSKLGANVIVNDTYRGIVFNSDLVTPLERGERVTGYVKHIREDGKLDCTVKPIGFRPAVNENQQIILSKLEKNGGVLYLHDKSPSETIRTELGMSKKQFKAAVGTLYRQRLIALYDNRIELKKEKKV